MPLLPPVTSAIFPSSFPMVSDLAPRDAGEMDGPRPRRGREKARAMRLTKRQASSNRQAILDATGRLLRMRGFDAVSVAGLMDEAGFTPAVAPPPTRSQGHADRYVIRHVGLT